MNLDEIYETIKSGKDVSSSYSLNGTIYDFKLFHSIPDKDINIPFLAIIPKKISNNQIVMESNNLETDDLRSILIQAGRTGKALANLTNNSPCPILVPFLPSHRNSPYFQQLSKECFEYYCL